MLYPWLFPMLPTMFVLLLLLFQPRHTWDTQEGVMGVPIPDQQLLVRRNHLERETDRGVGRGQQTAPCASSAGRFRPTLAISHLLRDPAAIWDLPVVPNTPHAQLAALVAMTRLSTITQHSSPAGLGHKQRNRQISSYGAHRRSWGLWSERTQRSLQLRDMRTRRHTETWRNKPFVDAQTAARHK